MLPRNFSDLSPELVLAVMRSLETPKDLFNLIRTSRHNHEIFDASKDSTLEALITNVIPSMVMPDALAACEASDVSILWWKQVPSGYIRSCPPPSELFRTSRKLFIEAYAHRRVPSRLRDSGHLLSLFKLWRIANDFLLDFQNHAFVFTAKIFPLLRSGWDNQISAAERARLLRAFFRFETFRRLFPEVPMTGSNDLNKRDFVQFLDLFPPWEREELLSVHEYLVSFAKNIYRELQDYLLDRLRVIGKTMKEEAEAQGAVFEREELKDIRAGLDLGSLDIFQSRQSLTRRRFQYLVSRGLPFLHWLAYLAPNERILALDICHVSNCHSSLFELMYEVGNHLPSRTDPVARTVNNESFGWRWARHSGYVQEPNDLLRRHVLRQTGFVFWNAERLISGWSLPKTSRDMINSPSRSQDDDDSDWNQEPTLEERFQTVIVAKGFFQDSEDGVEAVFKASEGFFGEFEDAFPLPFSQEETARFGIEY